MTTPPAAEPSPAARAALAYVDAVNGADLDALLALFEPDAVLLHPMGTYEGVDAMAGFYRDLVFAGQAQLRTGRLLVDPTGTIAMLELIGSSPLDDHAAQIPTLDVFDVSPTTAAITTLTIYAR